ncbi:MAG: hypothetical protein QM689_12830 [Oscillospiraceae bacterium]
MDLNNKQHLANLLAMLDAINGAEIFLPESDKSINSSGETSLYSGSWWDEFFDIMWDNPKKTIKMTIDDASLSAYNFILDGVAVHIVALSYMYAPPEGCALMLGHIKNKKELVGSWLGNTALSEHKNHVICDFAKMARYDDGSFD